MIKVALKKIFEVYFMASAKQLETTLKERKTRLLNFRRKSKLKKQQ
jgi:hypothetical protein